VKEDEKTTDMQEQVSSEESDGEYFVYRPSEFERPNFDEQPLVDDQPVDMQPVVVEQDRPQPQSPRREPPRPRVRQPPVPEPPPRRSSRTRKAPSRFTGDEYVLAQQAPEWMSKVKLLEQLAQTPMFADMKQDFCQAIIKLVIS
jgi:hypothetical protein